MAVNRGVASPLGGAIGILTREAEPLADLPAPVRVRHMCRERIPDIWPTDISMIAITTRTVGPAASDRDLRLSFGAEVLLPSAS